MLSSIIVIETRLLNQALTYDRYRRDKSDYYKHHLKCQIEKFNLYQGITIISTIEAITIKRFFLNIETIHSLYP